MGRGKGIIVGRRCPKIQTCPTCGRMRVNHPNADYYICPVPKEVTEALRRFKTENGVRWKSKLEAAWLSDREMRDMSGPLALAKTMIGPGRLHKIKLPVAPIVESLLRKKEGRHDRI